MVVVEMPMKLIKTRPLGETVLGLIKHAESSPETKRSLARRRASRGTTRLRVVRTR